MSNKSVKALIITGYGINCEEEMAAAYTLAGAEATICHLNDILVEGLDIHGFDIVNFPGGFSFGDDIASGRVLANKIKYKRLPGGSFFIDELRRFIRDGKFVLGICNGFQVLVKLGLLPDFAGECSQEVSLSRNVSSKFEDRWCYCTVSSTDKTPFLKGISTIHLPVRHGEGRLIFRDDAIREKLVNEGLNVISYSDRDGNLTDEYPANPNGSELSIAGICDTTGHVFGMMPHPEAYLSLYNNPDWGHMKRQNPDISEEGEGLKLFTNIVTHIQGDK